MKLKNKKLVCAKIIDNIFIIVRNYQTNEEVLNLVIYFLCKVALLFSQSLNRYSEQLIELTNYLVEY